MSDTPTTTPLDELLAQPLARVATRRFTWPELLAWAEATGVLRPYWADLASAQALLEQMQAAGDALPQEEVQEAANAWRYRRGLITAEETQDWLERRGLDLEALFHHLCRRLWRERAGPVDHAQPVPWPPPEHTPASAARLLWAEAQFAGSFRALALPALWRALVDAFILHRGENDATVMSTAQAFLAGQAGVAPELWSPAALFFGGESLNGMVQSEARYRRHLEDIAGMEDCRRRLPALRPALTRLDLEWAEFDDDDVAREARLCVWVDGESLEAVARRAAGRWQRTQAFGGDLPEELRDTLLSIQPGECLGPLAGETPESRRLWRVWRKQDPSLADPEVHRRVRQALIEDTFAQYVNDDVHWLRVPPD